MCSLPQIKLCSDRGVELNLRRLRGDLVDVTLIVGAVKCPAHKFILAAHSPYMAAMLHPENSFAEANQDEIQLKGLPDGHFFAEILAYLYTGQILVHEDNVFEYLEIAEYLQLAEAASSASEDSEGIRSGCLRYLTRRLKTCELGSLLKVWNVAERYGYVELKARVMRVLERRLSEFLPRDLFMFLGYEEIKEVLQLQSLCVPSEKLLFDTLAAWATRKMSKDDPDDVAMVLDLVSCLKMPLLHPEYVRKGLKEVLGDHRRLSNSAVSNNSRMCTDCVYVFEYTKSDAEILGIREFVAKRREQPTYAFFDPNARTAAIVNAFTQSKSYFQHYGPMSSTDFQLVAAARQLHAFGGISRDADETISSEIRVFDLESGQWEHRGGRMPENLVQFGVVFYQDDFYVFGGLTDEFASSGTEKASFRGRMLNVSQGVYRMRRRTPASSSLETNCERLPTMPRARASFTACRLDTQVFLLGTGFCDRFDLLSREWAVLAPPPDDVGARPRSVALGTRLYVFGDRPNEHSNRFYYLETSTLQWVTVPRLGLRQTVIDAFAHNGLVYLFGWQRQQETMVHEFNPLTGRWRLLITDMTGTVREGALVSKYVIGDASFFDKMVPISHVKHVEEKEAEIKMKKK